MEGESRWTLESHSVIRRRPVCRRNRRVVETQINSQLCAMVHQVIEEHLPVCQEFPAIEDRLALKA